MRDFKDILADYDCIDEGDARYRFLIELGDMLEPMPDALKTSATRVRGCSASVWLYPVRTPEGCLHFLADSNAHITKGIVALIVSAVQDKSPRQICDTDIRALLAPFALNTHLSANRTQGIPNMIALIQETAARLAQEA